jgi:SAM-dependent methyltransferase
MSDPALIGEVERYYSDKVARHGPTPLGVDWNDAAGQNLRFERLLRVLDGAGPQFSINDYGCGYGGLVDALAQRGEHFSYHGFDVSESMAAAGRRRYAARPDVHFVSSRSELGPADYTVASGIFNVRQSQRADAWERYVLETVDDLVALSRHGVAFNALTAYADRPLMRDDLYYADPAFLLDHCLRRFSRNVIVDHDYELYEFTVIIRLDRRPPAVQHQGGSADE